MSKTPYGPREPHKTPYEGKSPVAWAHRAGKCPACRSERTYRDFYAGSEPRVTAGTNDRITDGCADGCFHGCAMEGCAAACDPMFWPIFLGLAVWALATHFFSRKRRDCTCLDCGHHWRSISPSTKHRS